MTPIDDQKPFPARAGRAAPAAFLHHPRHHRDGRLCLAEGCEMAGGAARSLDPRSGYPQISRSRERLHRKPARPHRAACRRSWSRKCAAGSRKTIPACRRRTGRSPISENSARAASTKCSAACRATAARTRSCSTATRSRPNDKYFKFGGARHSPDHKLQAWSADTKGSEYFSIRVRDWADRRRISTTSSRKPTAAWSGARTAKSFFYVKLDDNHRPMQVWRHRLGTKQADDMLVYEEAGFRLVHPSA